MNKLKKQILSQKIKNYLGSPVTIVELTKEQINLAIKNAIDSFNFKYNTFQKLFISKKKKEHYIFNIALSNSMKILGNIRGKMHSIPVPGGESVILNYNELFRQSEELYNHIN